MITEPALSQQSFGGEQLVAMGVAFDHACQSLGLSEKKDPLTDLIAAKIVETAEAGECDAVRLYEAVMQWAAAA